MSDSEQRMLAFARLAAESRSRKQSAGMVRFLLLAGIAAARSGFPEVSRRCRELVLEQSPHHLVANYATIEEALRSDDFQPYVASLERFCTFERAELLLDEMHLHWQVVNDRGEQCLEWLATTDKPHSEDD